MNEAIDSSIACIYFHNREEIAGTAFSISKKHIITCAHVITEALNCNEELIPKDLITLSFLKHKQYAKERLTAKVIKWFPAKKGSGYTEVEDVAILELCREYTYALSSPKLVNLTGTDYFHNRDFKTYGFSTNYGIWTSGKCSGTTIEGWVQLNVSDSAIEFGFSGAPVWDTDEQGVTGMLVAAQDARRLAYMIPLSTLLRAWSKISRITVPRNPYRGLYVFYEQHQQDFFGRGDITHELKQTVTKTPFLLVMGTSGSGKSSLLNAGLIPSLLEKNNYWLVIKIRPLQDPLKELASAFIKQLYQDPLEQIKQTKILKNDLKRENITLTELCFSLLEIRKKKHLLLIVDQFEELYTSKHDISTQEYYLKQLLSLIDSDKKSITLLLSLRADFMASLASYKPLAKILNYYSEYQIIISAMSSTEIKEAIEKPANNMGVSFEKGLVERILEELDMHKNDGKLPLLEFALDQLWKKQSNRILTHQALQDIGGVSNALANHAENVLTGNLQDKKEIVQRIMVQLIAPSVGAEDTRQVANATYFPQKDRYLLPILATHRLIIIGGDKENDTVEIIHEALIREWPRLRIWMNEHREFRVWQNRMRERMNDWDERGRIKEGLLIGRYLLEAKDYLLENHTMLSENDQIFIKYSIKADSQQKIIRKGITLTIFTTIVLIAVIANLQRQSALDLSKRAEKAELEAKNEVKKSKKSEKRASYEASRAKESERRTNIEAAKAKESERRANIEANKAKKSRELAKNQAKKAQIAAKEARDAKNKTDNLIDTLVRSIPVDGGEIDLKIIGSVLENSINDSSADAKTLVRYAVFMDKKMKNYFKAKELFLKAIKISPNYEISNDYVLFLSKNKHMENNKDLIVLYKEALEISPENVGILLELILHNKITNKKTDKELMPLYERLSKLDTSILSYVLVVKGWEEYKNGNAILAKQLYEVAVGVFPNNTKYINNLAWIYFDLKEYEKAEYLYNKGISLEPKKPVLLVKYAQLKLLQGDIELGNELLTKAFPLIKSKNKSLLLEYHVLRYTHFYDESSTALNNIISLLKKEVYSKLFIFEDNIKQAEKQKHPRIEFLKKIILVIKGKAFIDALNITKYKK